MVFFSAICPGKRREGISDGNSLPFVLETICLHGNIKILLPVKYKLGIFDGKSMLLRIGYASYITESKIHHRTEIAS